MSGTAAKPPDKLKRLLNRLRTFSYYNIVVYIVLLNLAFIFLYPFLYMLATSFKSYSDLMDVTVKWFPREFTPGNWMLALKELGILPNEEAVSALPRPLINSVVVSLAATLGHVLSCSFVAYGFARFNFPLKNVLFVLVIVTLIVPAQTLIVSQNALYSTVGWTDSVLPLIVPAFLGMGLKGGLFIFLFRQSFMKLPPALEEAAAIDGCNPYYTYLRIIIPTSGPVMLVCSILSVVWHWNDYFEPFIYIHSSEKYLLPQMLPDMMETLKAMQISVDEGDLLLRQSYTMGMIMAGTAIVVAPLVIMYFILQGRFAQSIDRTGLVE